MNDRATPQIHPTERLTTPDGTDADIDTEIVPLVRALWRLGLATTASCQDFGEGTAGQRNANPRPSWYGGRSGSRAAPRRKTMSVLGSS
jgi:hypothetical protein